MRNLGLVAAGFYAIAVLGIVAALTISILALPIDSNIPGFAIIIGLVGTSITVVTAFIRETLAMRRP